MKKVIFLLFLLGSNTFLAQVKLKEQNDKVIIENSKIIRIINIHSDKPSAITNEFVTKENNEQLANNTGQWFSFTVNDITVSSTMPIWTLKKVKERNMINDGVEYTITFTSNKLKGLLVDAVIQTYDKNEFYRERFMLKTESDSLFFLTTVNNKLNFNFGEISFLSRSNNISFEELRIATWNGKLIATDYSSSIDPKSFEEGWRVGRNLEQNYMYHPKAIQQELTNEEAIESKGPFTIILDKENNTGIWLAYEHGSPDDDIEQDYISINTNIKDKIINSNISYKNGAYYNGEEISKAKPYSTVWYSYNFFNGDCIEDSYNSIWEYLYKFISENDYSRKPFFYYNTWGMQRDESKRGNDIRGILTEEKVKKEIDNAAELGIDLFVLDDGWQDKFGDWNPNRERFPNGLKFYVDKCRSKGIIPGIWLAALATDQEAEITKQHPEWLLKEDDGNLVVGRWDKNFFCFDSDYKDYFVSKCKALIDQGIRYFKWDGIDKHLCSSAQHHHGTVKQSPEERKKLQGFDMPLLVADAVRELKEYQPDVVVEIDVTEAERSVGLAILSEARYFWMNNGASWYGDYSTYRSKSMRMITNLFGKFMPTTLQTYADFPMNSPVYQAQHYNVNSSLIGGRGFWGNISRMGEKERLRVGHLVNKIKRIENQVVSFQPKITGLVGSSPEIYEYVNKAKSAGKIIAFSGSALKYDYTVSDIDPQNILGILDNSYKISNDSLVVNFEFYMPEDTKEIVILPNNNSGISVISSTSWLDNIELNGNNLQITNGAPGKHIIKWAKELGEPEVKSDKKIENKVELLNDEFYLVTIKTFEKYSFMKIYKSN